MNTFYLLNNSCFNSSEIYNLGHYRIESIRGSARCNSRCTRCEDGTLLRCRNCSANFNLVNNQTCLTESEC